MEFLLDYLKEKFNDEPIVRLNENSMYSLFPISETCDTYGTFCIDPLIGCMNISLFFENKKNQSV